MADPTLQYLAADFDPSSLTVPRLRSILVEHDVTYPSSAKKSQLVDIFNDRVAPQASRLLGVRGRTKRSARGIEDVPSVESSVAGSVDGDAMDVDEVVDQVMRDVGRSTRKTPSRASVLRSLEEHSPPRSVRTTRSSRASASLASESEAETPVPARRARAKVSVTPASVREEEELTETEPEEAQVGGRAPSVDSPFTQDNPFQQQNDLDATPIATERRRRTLGPWGSEKGKTESMAARRRTDFMPAVREKAKMEPVKTTRKSMAAPVTRAAPDPGLMLDGSPEPGEEFTAEEQQELDVVKAQGKGRKLVTARPPRKQPNALFTSAIWAVSLAMLGGVGLLWRQEKVEIGYCGIGRPSTAIAGIHIPEWAEFLRPQCEPCPPHAYCYSKMRTNCETDFIMQQHPLSLGGLIPLPPTCEADGDKARRIKSVADRAVEELRDRNAKWECGELRDADGKREQQAAIQEPLLKESIASHKSKGMSQEEFEDIWHAALGEMIGRDEIVSSADGSSGHRTLRSTSLASMPFSCAVRRSIRVALARHIWKLVALISVAVGIMYTRFSILSSRTTELKAKNLASLALDRLRNQASLAVQDPERFPEGFVGVAQLRDDVLREEFSAKRRQKLWSKVQAKVEGNANVRSAVREGRSGEVGRVWEWVGAVDAEDGGSGRKRDGTRMSLGSPLVGGSPSLGYGSGSVKKEDRDDDVRSGGERSRWSEGRPVY